MNQTGTQTFLAITWRRLPPPPVMLGYANGGSCASMSTDWKRIKVANQCAL